MLNYMCKFRVFYFCIGSSGIIYFLLDKLLNEES